MRNRYIKNTNVLRCIKKDRNPFEERSLDLLDCRSWSVMAFFAMVILLITPQAKLPWDQYAMSKKRNDVSPAYPFPAAVPGGGRPQERG